MAEGSYTEMAESLSRCYLEPSEREKGSLRPLFGAHNSAVECHLHTVEVVGSNPAVPTNPFNNLGGMTVVAFAAFCGISSED